MSQPISAAILVKNQSEITSVFWNAPLVFLGWDHVDEQSPWLPLIFIQFRGSSFFRDFIRSIMWTWLFCFSADFEGVVSYPRQTEPEIAFKCEHGWRSCKTWDVNLRPSKGTQPNDTDLCALGLILYKKDLFWKFRPNHALNIMFLSIGYERDICSKTNRFIRVILMGISGPSMRAE